MVLVLVAGACTAQALGDRHIALKPCPIHGIVSNEIALISALRSSKRAWVKAA
jgi:hypothetical protein